MKYCSFPLKDKCRLAAWLNAIKRENWTPSKYDTVCNEHFTANDFLPCREAYKTFLRPTAVPSIFPLSIKRKKYKKRKINNENKKNEEDNIEKNNKPYDTNFTNIYDNIDNIKIDQDVSDSYNDINVQSEISNKTPENVHTIVDIVEEPNLCNINIHNNIILKTYNQETAATEKSCITSSSIYKPIGIEMKRVNDYDSLNSIRSHYIKSLPTPTEVDLRHKIRMLQQKLRRRDAKIIYLRRLLTHLKQKV